MSRPVVEHEERRPRDYHDLLVWQKGMALAQQIYRLTQTFPDTERFGLVTQMRRAAVSVPSNIAEGQAHNTTGEFIQFLSHAVGSVSELDTQLRLSVELGFCSQLRAQEAQSLILELRKMITALRRKLADGS
ncbi:MAG: four helix bundle protein [Acidobacteriia bacterium]|nr:four helix bundle protein [Terriglobia bacterium]